MVDRKTDNKIDTLKKNSGEMPLMLEVMNRGKELEQIYQIHR